MSRATASLRSESHPPFGHAGREGLATKQLALVCLVVLSGLVMVSSAASPVHADIATTPLNLGSCGFILFGNWDSNTNTCTLSGGSGYSSTFLLSTTLQVPSGTTLTIDSGNSLDDFYGIVNNGTINNYGVTSNTGVTGLTLEGLSLYNSGVLNNYGDIYLQVLTLGTCVQSGANCYPTLENDAGGVVNNEGSIISVYCTFEGENCGDAGQVTNEAGGDFTNSGTITLTQPTGVCAASPNGGDCFSNSGDFRTIISSGSCTSIPLSQSWDSSNNTCTIGSGTTYTISAGSSILVPPGITLAVDGTIANNGEIDNDGVIFVSGAISPFGTVTNSDGSTVTFVLSSSLCTGTLDGSWSSNTCTIGSGQTSVFDSAYILQIDSGLTLVNQGTLAITLNLYSGGSFTNTGTFTSQNFMNNYGAITNSGSFDNTASAEIQDVGPISNSGTFTNEGSISLTCIDSPEGSGCGTLLNTGTFESSGTVSGYSDSITEACVATFGGNQPPAGAIRNIPCAPTITTASGVIAITGGVTVSGTENLASNGGSPLNIYISSGCFLCNDLLTFTATNSAGAWSVFVPLSPGTYSLYAIAETCSGGINQGCYGSEYGSLGSNSITVTVDQTLDQTTCQSVIGGTWSSSTCTFGGQFTFLSGDSLTIGSGTTLANQAAGKLTNDGSLIIQGTVTNSGTIANQAGGTVTDSGTITDVGTGTISNSGTFTINLNSATCQSYPLDGSWNPGYISTCTVPSGTSVTILAGVTLDVPNGDSLYNSGSITNSGTISLSSASFYYTSCGGTLTGNPVSGSGTIQFAPCAPAITTSSGVYLTGSLTISGTSNLASNGGAAMVITLYSGSSEIGSATTGSGGAWTIVATPSAGVLTLYATATSSESIASPPSAVITVTYQLLDQASCLSPIGGTWSTNSCSLSGTFVLPGSGALEIPSGTTLSVSTSGAFTNNGAITNLGTITNGGTFSNVYLVSGGEPVGATLTSSGIITNQGAFLNEGQLTVSSGGAFTNNGQLTNGKLPVTNPSVGGQLTISSGAAFTNSPGATMVDQTDSGVGYSGTFTNGGSITLDDFSNLGGTGTFLNSGTFTSDSGIIAVEGPFTNTGTFTSSTTQGEVAELNVDDGGSFLNSGTVTLTTAGEVYIDTYGAFTNGVGATVNSQFGIVVVGTLTNYGSINNSVSAGFGTPSDFGGSVDVLGTLTNFGAVTNSAGAALKVQINTDLGLAGVLNNYGSITNSGAASNAATFDEYCGSTFTGNAVSGISPVTITAVACPPTITPPGTVETTTGSATPTISGTSVASVTVNLYLVSAGTLQPLGTTTSSSGGAWSVTTSPLSSGTYTLIATTSSSAGASGLSNPATLEIASLQATTTSVSCVSPATTGTTTTCTATVSGASPSGTVSFTSLPVSSALGLPPSCTLSPVTSSCAVTLTPASGSQASYMVTASYGGDSNNAASIGTATLVVEQPDTTAQGSTTTTVASGGASSNQTPTTGVGVTITDSSASAGTSVTITTEDLSSPSSNVGVSNLDGTQYYDVSVMGITDGTAQVCITSTTPTLTVEYWSGSSWVEATGITISGDTTCGDIPVLALTGTNVIVGDPAPPLSVSPTSGPPATVIALSGSGYTAGAEYGACLSTSSTAVDCVSGSASPTFYATLAGDLPASVTVTVPYGNPPTGLPGGTYYVIVISGTTIVSEYAPFTVVQLVPTLSVSPSSGPPGTSITLSGAEYLPGLDVGACLSTSSTVLDCVVGSATTIFYTTDAGDLPGSPQVQVPYGSPPYGTPAGQYYVAVIWASSAITYAPFTVVSLVPTVSLSASSGLPGTSTTLAGSSYLPGDQYGACLSTSPSTEAACIQNTGIEFFATTAGDIPTSATVTVPYGSLPTGTPGGNDYVVVYSTNGGTVVSDAPFVVDPLVPSVQLSVSSGPPGTSTTLTGAEYLPGIQYGACLSTSPSSLASCLEGSAPMPFYTTLAGNIPASEMVSVPSGASAGNDYVIVYSSFGSTVVSDAPFTVITPLTVTLGSSASSIFSDGVSSETFTATPSGGSGSYTNYAWNLPSSLAGTGCTTSSATCTVTSTTPGSYSVSVTVTDSDSETATSNSVPLTVQQSLTAPTVTPSSNVFDAGQQESFSVSWTGGTGPYTLTLETSHTSGECFNPLESSVYTSSSVSGDSATFNGIVFIPELPSTEYYCATVSDSSSPQEVAQSTVGTITINSDPSGLTVSANLTTLSQGGASLLSSVGPTGGTSPYGYQWSVISPGSQYLLEIPGATGPTYAFTTSTSTAPGIYTFVLASFDSKGLETLSTNAAQVTVSKVSSSTSTDVFDSSTGSPWSGSEVTGASAYDTAIVVGEPAFVPTGTVTYSFYSGTSCSGTVASQDTVSLSAGVVPQSSATAALAAGPYAFQASYSGDSNYLSSTGACEPFSVAKAPSTTASTVFDSSTSTTWSGTEVAGASAFDTGSVTGVSGFTPTGTAVYELFGDGTCSGTPSTTQTVTLSGGAVPSSSSTGPIGAGSYSFSATYSGDSNYYPSSGACEALAVGKASPTLATLVSNSGTITVGSSATDKSTLSGAFSPTGSVTFTAYSDSACTLSVFTSAEGVIGSSATSASFTPASAGTYYWKASYAGDANNNGVTTVCGASGETLTVSKASPTVATSLSATTIYAGQSVYDKATLAGATAAGGTMTYEYFSGASCSGSPTVVGSPVTVTNGAVPNSASHSFGAGSYGWEAVYSGDSNNRGTTGACEPLSVQKAPSSSSVTCAPNPAAIGSSTTCTAKVTGDSPGGSVTFTTSSSTGAFSPTSAQCSLSGGTCSVSYSDTTAGAITITASYGGDANNLASSGSTSLTESYKSCAAQVRNGGGQNLAGANLEYCNLAGYQMGGDNLAGANLQHTDLQNTNLQGSNLAAANLANSYAPGATFQGANLAGANLSYINAAGANFQGDNLAGANLQGATLTGDSLQGANLANSNLSGASASGTNLQGANLQGANLSNSNFSHAEFQGTNLSNSNMSHGDFNYANFQGANTHGANITGATFVGATDAP